MNQSVGVSVIDPHRDLARDILAYPVESGFFERDDAFERLIYVDFAVPRYVPFNILKAVALHSAHSNDLIGVQGARENDPQGRQHRE
jgi:hypothetical protein